jgi:hypothetical protein
MRSWNTAIEWQAAKVNATVLNEWRSTQESQNLPWWESQKRIHQIIKVIDRILNPVCIKKNDTKQLCVNYRQLNKITKQDSYSLLLIKELQDRLDRVKWFTSLNLKEAYYWVQMKKGKEWKTAFWTRYRHYKYTVMLFELKNAPHLSKVNQWHIERIPWWFCNHIPWWHSDIFRWPWDALQPCAQGTEKLRALYVKKSKASLKQRKSNSLIMLFNLSKSRRTQKRQTQSETGLRQNESRKYKPF